MEHDALVVHLPGSRPGQWLSIPFPVGDLPARAQLEILTRTVEEMARAMRDTMRPGAARAPETPARPAPWRLPPADEPCTDGRLFATLMPLLEELAGLTNALTVVSPDAMPAGQLAAVLRAMDTWAQAAPTILQRWWDDRQAE